MADEERALVALGGRVLDVAGLSDMVWGHVSLRDPGGRGIWIKARGLGFDEVTAANVQLVGWDGELLEGEGGQHREYPIHTEILRARVDVASVVHVHPPHAIAFGASGHELQVFSHAAGFIGTGLRRYAGAPGLVDTAEGGVALARALGGDRALLLTGHGVVTAGPSVELAVMTAVTLERACEIQLRADGYGGVAAPLGEFEAARAYAHTLSDHHLLGAWRYLARRVGAA
jgi:ribulose-5-phosphate 4-epimerase/fuculose-1-phosphate aldolase